MVTMIFQSPGVNPGASKPPQGNASSKGRPSRGSRLWAKRRLWTGAGLFFFVGRVLCQAEGGGKVLGKQCKGGDAILLALNCNKFCFRALQAIIVSKKVEGPAYQVHPAIRCSAMESRKDPKVGARAPKLERTWLGNLSSTLKISLHEGKVCIIWNEANASSEKVVFCLALPDEMPSCHLQTTTNFDWEIA